MRRGRRQIRRAVAVVVGAVAACGWGAGVARGQEGPLIVGERPTYDKVHFEKPSIALELINQYSQDKRDVAAGGEGGGRFTELLFQQTLYLDTTGYVLHPNFIDIKAKVAGGVSEAFFDSDVAGNGNETDPLYNWDLSATLLPKGDTPLTVYSKREQSWVNREFGPTLENTSTQTGAILDVRTRRTQSRLEVSRMDLEQTGLDGVEDFALTRDFATWHTTARPTDTQTLNLDYTFSRVDETGALDQKYDEHNATARHEVLFGEGRRSSLTSTFNYFDQSGTTNLQTSRIEELARLQHTENFETRYRYQFNQADYGTTDRMRHRGSAEFTHRLYKSLVTTGRAGAEAVDYSGAAETFETFADIRFDYTKAVPLGRLNLGLGFGWDDEDNSANANPVKVVDELETFPASDAQPILLVGRNIDPRTIVITDPSGLLLYSPGTDYTTRAVADGIEIHRVVGGRIAPAAPVLLDYTLNPSGENRVTSTTLQMSGRYDFLESFLKGLGVYASYAKLDQSISTDDPTAVVPNSYDDVIVGSDYKFWDAMVGAEYEMHDAQVSPFDATRAYARFGHRLTLDTVLTFNAAYTNIEYTDSGETTDLYTASATVQHDFTRELKGSVTVLWRDQTDSISGKTRGLEEQAELRWQHRQTSVFVTLRNSNLDTPQENSSFQFLQIGIRREF